VELVSYELDPQPEQGLLHLNLAWRSLAHTKESYLVQVELLDRHNQVVSYWLGYNGQGRLPTLAWDPGDSVFDRLALPLPNLPGGDYTVRVQVMSNAGPLPVQQGSSSGSSLPLATLHLNQPANLSLSQHLSLTAPAGSVEVAFALWQTDGPVIQPAIPPTYAIRPRFLSSPQLPCQAAIRSICS